MGRRTLDGLAPALLMEFHVDGAALAAYPSGITPRGA
jgi:hypothetical protein